MKRGKKVEILISDDELKMVKLLKIKYNIKTNAGLLRYLIKEEGSYIVSDFINNQIRKE